MSQLQTFAAAAFGACLGFLWGYRKGCQGRSIAMMRLEERLEDEQTTDNDTQEVGR